MRLKIREYYYDEFLKSHRYTDRGTSLVMKTPFPVNNMIYELLLTRDMGFLLVKPMLNNYQVN